MLTAAAKQVPTGPRFPPVVSVDPSAPDGYSAVPGAPSAPLLWIVGAAAALTAFYVLDKRGVIK